MEIKQITNTNQVLMLVEKFEENFPYFSQVEYGDQVIIVWEYLDLVKEGQENYDKYDFEDNIDSEKFENWLDNKIEYFIGWNLEQKEEELDNFEDELWNLSLEELARIIISFKNEDKFSDLDKFEIAKNVWNEKIN